MLDLSACVHRGKKLEQTPQAGIYTCAVHGRCSVMREVEGVATCQGCPDFKTQSTAKPRRVRFGTSQRAGKVQVPCVGCKGNVTRLFGLPDLNNPVSQWASAPTKTYGVLTGAKAEYMPTLHALALACRKENVPVAVADHGLTRAQLEILTGLGAVILPHAEGTRQVDPARSNRRPPSAPEAWLKPSVCLRSPFAYTVWIDADAVPVNGIWDLFDLPFPWLTRDWWVSLETKPKRYQRILAALGLPAPAARKLHINSGVFGFVHGDKWIQQWADMCAFILAQPRLLSDCGPRDQSALVALLARGVDVRISDDRALNYPANNLPSHRMNERKKYPLEPDAFLRAVRADHSDAKVVHWLGRFKPWKWGVKMPAPQFTKDWVTGRLDQWLPFAKDIADTPCRLLEIGAYEGRGTRWMLEHLGSHPDAKITCIDPWGSTIVEGRFDRNLAGLIGTRVEKIKGFSQDVLRKLDQQQFNLIYIDGSHLAKNVLADAVLCWPLLAPGGLLVFDDYGLRFKQPIPGEAEPKVAIDGFLKCFAGVLEVLHQGFQVIVRKRNSAPAAGV